MTVHFELAANFNKACFDLEIGPVEGNEIVDILQQVYDMVAKIETVDAKPLKPLKPAKPTEEMATQGQLNYLKGLGVKITGPLTKKEANKLIQENKWD